ncbi:PREDICTED: mitochondrial import inner membrane translocase subunit Tim22 isoform X1 [Vollenhovia emeryi]|uniref:mitochondrial import inner membrane translocase subunit Tim22 isoform X1 n=1 Tax=Vollenhovia emeryi TaxID=411798 RepID=UPI0005F42769|nr:PREDICTED: mitochondrial import inner membrane translocase subunit Tim22 isoform X1 [Vollenhovia emeryi]XP_011866335.1 PREDICTED: mitochondrial import inner membrane translocase subunit Tim22 isoform X1 [Vollenhovia emeryi]XP_011866336.1 PREDICTED: mitochondrial import inner membrane translocase subunit Tim22 isoform X1 [Vollenhovia emeryi]
MYPADLTKTLLPATAEKKVSLSDTELDNVALYLLDNQKRYRENIIIPTMMGPVQIKTIEEKRIESAMESCAFKGVMSCVLGYGLGLAFGVFTSSLNPSIGSLEKQQTAREVLTEMKTTSLSLAKNFAIVGGLFTSIECAIESRQVRLEERHVCGRCNGRTNWLESRCKSGHNRRRGLRRILDGDRLLHAWIVDCTAEIVKRYIFV